jgi:hypothetical protein
MQSGRAAYLMDTQLDLVKSQHFTMKDIFIILIMEFEPEFAAKIEERLGFNFGGSVLDP